MAALGQNKYEYKIKSTSQAVVEHTFNPSTWEADFYEFQASLFCKSKFQDSLQSYEETLSQKKKIKSTMKSNCNGEMKHICYVGWLVLRLLKLLNF